jgi:asparagine synthase (glutamine-hydrolysing)
MCGIAGFVGDAEGRDEGQILSEMVRSLAHRGPDDQGVWSDPERRVHLGHRRLSIVDPADGRQPMSSVDDRLVVIFNGEIYNHLELRADLEKLGHRFVSDHSDTEVLLHAYREWGESCALRLNGMWAFAIFDRLERRLFLSRDRFGQKPLYYSEPVPGSVVFASELDALLCHPRVEARVDPISIRKYFAYGYIPAPRSIHRGIHKLPAGSNLVLDLDGDRARVSRYWEFRVEPMECGQDAGRVEVWGEELLHLLERAVERRLMADVPLGVFLSGGIDSSAVAALASRLIAPRKLETFSIGFEDASFDESEQAAAVADTLGSNHHTARFSERELRETSSLIATQLDEPMADSSLLPTHLLCGEARRRVRVVLGGDGADELFAGYDPFKALGLAGLYSKHVPRPLHRAIRLLATRLPTVHRNMSLDFKLKRTLAGLDGRPALWNPIWMAPLGPRELSQLLEEPVDEEELYSEAIEAWESCESGSSVDRTLQFFTRLYLQDGILCKIDRASMMHGLEVRSPFLDIALVDFARRLPADVKLRRGRTKWILKRALRPLLPKEVLHRAKKGFGIPLGRWFRNAELCFDDRGGAEGLFRSFRDQRLSEHRSGAADHRLYLWSQWLLERWLAEHGSR